MDKHTHIYTESQHMTNKKIDYNVGLVILASYLYLSGLLW
jgi:hypothetical protein